MKRTVLAIALFVLTAADAGEWADWRGPRHNGVSDEKGLVSSWSVGGENLVWKAALIGRSTPVVFDGRVCVMGRTDPAKDRRQEQVACFDAETGKLLWEDRYNVHHTTVPFQRVGWGSPAADLETGTLYTLGVAGDLRAYDRAGKLVWSNFLTETFGRMSGYGGRTQTPLVVDDLVILSVVNIGWGEQGPPRDRYFAFDKRTGEPVWIATPGREPADFNTQSVPVVADVAGRRLIVNGNADGWIYALEAHTGEKVWEFNLSKIGLNANVVVDGARVYANHGEENVDEPTMGRVVAIDATGTGDVTKTRELWRADKIEAGFSSPTLADGVLYVVDNSANLIALDAEKGTTLWTHSLGTVGKASPVLADGKMYVGEVNGRFHILKPSRAGVETLDVEELKMPDGRYAEIYGSVAVAYGRLYFTAENGLYCLADKTRPFETSESAPPPPIAGSGEPARLRVVPAEVLIEPGQSVTFRVRAYDGKGNPLGEVPASWSLEGFAGTIDESGRLTADPAKPFQGGKIVAKAGALSASARARAIRPLPWSFDFEAMTPPRPPGFWIAAGRPWELREIDGNKVLVKIVRDTGLLRNQIFMGPPDLADYTIEADFLAARKGRRIPDVGLIAGGYTLDLMGAQQQLQIRDWASELRFAPTIDFAWETDRWYTMKFRVDNGPDRTALSAKIWPRGEVEPADWTMRVEDEMPISGGSPGLIGYSPAEIYFDNILVTPNE